MRLRLVALLALAGILATGCHSIETDVSVVVSGLAKPWDIAFTPDGTMLFTERDDGSVNAYVGNTVVELAAPTDAITLNWEAGMMGLAVDPDFATNRRIYACFTSDLGGTPHVRVGRWEVDAGYTTATNRVDIIDDIPLSSSILIAHAGCRPRFGPDGYLWVTTGDGRSATAPQDPNSLAGKVLRVDTDGVGAPDNPGAPLRAEIYTYGHRNPQGIAFRSDGTAFSIEHGSNCDDEINQLVAGANYGWDPQQPGGGDPYNDAVPMTDLVKFPTAVEAVISSGCPTIAPSGGTFVTGSQWGIYEGALAVVMLKERRLDFYQLDASGWAPTGGATEVADQGRLRSVVQGPDGNLYLAQDKSPGAILRLTPAPPEH